MGLGGREASDDARRVASAAHDRLRVASLTQGDTEVKSHEHPHRRLDLVRCLQHRSAHDLRNTGGITMSIAVGQTAPDFTLLNQDKKEVKLSDFAGKKNVVLVWYPLDWSPTCTNEHACFVNDMRSFDSLDAEVLGVSVDSVWSHKAYAEKMGIKYSLLADFHPRGAMSEKYGVYLADKGITGRSIAIVNKAGKVAWFKNYDIPVVPDVKEVAAALQQVKAATA
jgi:peroxiredoxin